MNLQPEILQDLLVKIIPLNANHFEEMFAVASDPLIWEQHPDNDRYKQEIFQKYFEEAVRSRSAFEVFDKENGELIGCTRYYDYNAEKSQVAIGYTFLSRKYWGGTYNRSMKKLLLDHAFDSVKTVLFHIGANNLRSQKAVLKLGAIKVEKGQENYIDEITCTYLLNRENWLEK